MTPILPRRRALATIAAVLIPLAGALPAADPTPAPATKSAGPADRAPSLDELFATLDTNHDGKISKEEATGTYVQRFAQWDADGDGFATREEIHNYRLRLGIGDDGKRIAAPASRAPRAGGEAARILKEPADWRLETMSVPPGFAPEVKLKGSEEIRFAPGMFDNRSDTYFTCVIAIAADGAPALGAAEIKDFLEKYYRGLSTGRAQRSGLKIDPAQMQATVGAIGDTANLFAATMDFFDSFSDGRKITLNIEARVLSLPAKNQTCMILLVSPSAKDSAVWQSLREIGKKTALGFSAPSADAEAMKSLETSATTRPSAESK